MNQRLTVRPLVSVTIILALLFCSACQESATHKTTPITICQYGDLLIYLPLYIAQDQKLFEREGVNVRFINGGGDDKTYAAVASGAAQFGVSDPTFTAI